jgi:uncharacterized protein YndB with AHSA1/START domain
MNDVRFADRGTISIDSERATVSFERRYARTRDEVWQALTEETQLARWLDDATVDLRVGGRFEVRFSDGAMVGRITALEDRRLLAYTWHEGRDDESHVSWELSDDDRETVVRLVHTRLRSRSAPGFAAGWHHHLELLDAWMFGDVRAWSDDRFADLMGDYARFAGGDQSGGA